MHLKGFSSFTQHVFERNLGCISGTSRICVPIKTAFRRMLHFKRRSGSCYLPADKRGRKDIQKKSLDLPFQRKRSHFKVYSKALYRAYDDWPLASFSAFQNFRVPSPDVNFVHCWNNAISLSSTFHGFADKVMVLYNAKPPRQIYIRSPCKGVSRKTTNSRRGM